MKNEAIRGNLYFIHSRATSIYISFVSLDRWPAVINLLKQTLRLLKLPILLTFNSLWRPWLGSYLKMRLKTRFQFSLSPPRVCMFSLFLSRFDVCDLNCRIFNLQTAEQPFASLWNHVSKIVRYKWSSGQEGRTFDSETKVFLLGKSSFVWKHSGEQKKKKKVIILCLFVFNNGKKWESITCHHLILWKYYFLC